MDEEFNKYCALDGSPRTVLRVARSKSKSTGEQGLENETQSLKDGFYEISFNRLRGASCRDAALKRLTCESSEEVKRESVYQCSTEVRLHKRNGGIVDRKKIEVSRENAPEFLEIVHSLCCSDEDISVGERDRSSRLPIFEHSTSTSSELHCHRPLAPYDATPKSHRFTSKERCDYLVKSRSSKVAKDCVGYSHRSEANEKHEMASPSHLHGVFLFENRKGGPFFGFSVKSTARSYVARTWKANNTLPWVYTFHSRRKGNANGWWLKDNSKQATVVGKMLVSYSLCTETKETGASIESLETECVLYDADQSRRGSSGPPGFHENMDQFHLLREADMRPELEIGAVVIQDAFKTTEGLKFEDSKSRKISVVIPAGIHGSPTSDDGGGPSSLLERWRSGGVCDCGGWDMACSLDVYGNPDSQILKGQFLMDHEHPGMLFDKGRRGGPPAFSIHAVEDGKYAVNFDAKLSALQAFSICIAFLHSAENNSTILSQYKSQESLHQEGGEPLRDSLRVFPEEIASLMDAIAEEEERLKPKLTIKQAMPSLVLNPPFSPIARV